MTIVFRRITLLLSWVCFCAHAEMLAVEASGGTENVPAGSRKLDRSVGVDDTDSGWHEGDSLTSRAESQGTSPETAPYTDDGDFEDEETFTGPGLHIDDKDFGGEDQKSHAGVGRSLPAPQHWASALERGQSLGPVVELPAGVKKARWIGGRRWADPKKQTARNQAEVIHEHEDQIKESVPGGVPERRDVERYEEHLQAGSTFAYLMPTKMVTFAPDADKTNTPTCVRLPDSKDRRLKQFLGRSTRMIRYFENVLHECIYEKRDTNLVNHLEEYAREALSAPQEEFVLEPAIHVDPEVTNHYCLVPKRLFDCVKRVENALSYLESYTSPEMLNQFQGAKRRPAAAREDDDAPAIPEKPDPTGTERIWAGYRFRFGNYLANLEAEKALPEHLRSSHFVSKEAQPKPKPEQAPPARAPPAPPPPERGYPEAPQREVPAHPPRPVRTSPKAHVAFANDNAELLVKPPPAEVRTYHVDDPPAYISSTSPQPAHPPPPSSSAAPPRRLKPPPRAKRAPLVPEERPSARAAAEAAAPPPQEAAPPRRLKPPPRSKKDHTEAAARARPRALEFATSDAAARANQGGATVPRRLKPPPRSKKNHTEAAARARPRDLVLPGSASAAAAPETTYLGIYLRQKAARSARGKPGRPGVVPRPGRPVAAVPKKHGTNFAQKPEWNSATRVGSARTAYGGKWADDGAGPSRLH